MLFAVASACGGNAGRDTEPPEGVSDLSTSPGDERVKLFWTNPNDSDLAGVVIRCSINQYPESALEGDLVFDGFATSHVHTGLANGVTYYYTAFAYDESRNYSWGESISATPFSSGGLPPAPTGLAATAGANEVSLAWNEVQEAQAYRVYNEMSSNVNPGDSPWTQSFTESATVTDLNAGTTYYFVVTALNSQGESNPSKMVSATPTNPLVVPEPPGGVQAIPGDSQVTVSWSAVPNADTYKVRFSRYAGSYASDNEVAGITGTSATVTNLDNDEPYYFVVLARNEVGWSDPSEEVSATPQAGPPIPAAPTGLAAVAGDGAVTLSWDEAPYADSYRVYPSDTPGVDKSSPNSIPEITDTTHTVTGLANGSTYYFVVTAENETGESPESGEVSATPQAGAQSENLDTSFGGAGYVTHDNAAGGDGADLGYGIAIDSNQRIVVAGASDNGSGDVDMAIWRLTAAGALDSTFGGAGYVTHNSAAGGSGDDYAEAVAVDAADRVIAAGWSTFPSGDPAKDKAAAIWRYNVNGALDTTFGGSGFVTYTGVGGGNDGFRAITLDASGRILVSGLSWVSSFDMLLIRYNPDGSLDTSFGGTGVVTHNNAAGGPGHDDGLALTIDGSNRIVVAGTSWGPTRFDLAVWRYDPDGSLDPSFGGTGYVTHNNAAGGNADDRGYSVMVESSGKIVVAGVSENVNGNNDLAIWRFNADGSLDTSFGPGGYVTFDGGKGSGDDWAFGAALDGSGRVVVTGHTIPAVGPYDLAVWRYLPSGALDPSFGGSGYITHNGAAGGDGADISRGVVMDSTGRIVVAGSSTNSAGDYDMAVWRINP